MCDKLNNHNQIEVIRYSKKYFDEWNSLVSSSKNSCLLHLRSFIEYHEDKYIDHSCLILENKKIKLLFPATEHNKEIRSHGGLTFGGLIMQPSAKSNFIINRCILFPLDLIIIVACVHKLIMSVARFFPFAIDPIADLHSVSRHGPCWLEFI